MRTQQGFVTEHSFEEVRDYVANRLIPAVRTASASPVPRLLKPRIRRDDAETFQISTILEKRLFLRVLVGRKDPGSMIEVSLTYRLEVQVFMGCLATAATLGVAALFFVPLYLWARQRFKRYADLTTELLSKDLQTTPA